MLKGTPNLHVFKVKYLPASRLLPSRIKIYSERFKRAIVISHNDERFDKLNGIQEMAALHLQSLSFNIAAVGEGDGCMYVMSDTFEPFTHVKSFKS